MTPTKTLSAMLYELADDLVVAGLIDNSAEVERAAERLDTLTVTVRGLEIQRDGLVSALDRLIFAAQCRDNTTGDPCRLIEVKAELAAAAENASNVVASVKGGA